MAACQSAKSMEPYLPAYCKWPADYPEVSTVLRPHRPRWARPNLAKAHPAFDREEFALHDEPAPHRKNRCSYIEAAPAAPSFQGRKSPLRKKQLLSHRSASPPI